MATLLPSMTIGLKHVADGGVKQLLLLTRVDVLRCWGQQLLLRDPDEDPDAVEAATDAGFKILEAEDERLETDPSGPELLFRAATGWWYELCPSEEHLAAAAPNFINSDSSSFWSAVCPSFSRAV